MNILNRPYCVKHDIPCDLKFSKTDLFGTSHYRVYCGKCHEENQKYDKDINDMLTERDNTIIRQKSTIDHISEEYKLLVQRNTELSKKNKELVKMNTELSDKLENTITELQQINISLDDMFNNNIKLHKKLRKAKKKMKRWRRKCRS